MIYLVIKLPIPKRRAARRAHYDTICKRFFVYSCCLYIDFIVRYKVKDQIVATSTIIQFYLDKYK